MQDNNYLHCTERERLELKIDDTHVGYICYQIDGKDGWYEVSENLEWNFVGGRPHSRPPVKGYLA